MRKTLLAGVSLLVLTVAARAQIAPGLATTWTGFYLGGTVGTGPSSGSHDITGLPVPGALVFGSTSSSFGANASAFAGFNYQVAPGFVLGVETDMTSLAHSHSVNMAGVAFPPGWLGFDGEDTYGPANIVGRTSLKWMGTLRTRVGFNVQNALFYATGGVAYGGVNSHTNITLPEFDGGPEAFPVTWSGQSSKTMVGWALGAGAEFMLTQNWTVRFEYLHYDLGRLTYTMLAFDPDGAGYTPFTTKAHVSGDLARVGVAFKF